jgi:hypothetical protein
MRRLVGIVSGRLDKDQNSHVTLENILVLNIVVLLRRRGSVGVKRNVGSFSGFSPALFRFHDLLPSRQKTLLFALSPYALCSPSSFHVHSCMHRDGRMRCFKSQNMRDHYLAKGYLPVVSVIRTLRSKDCSRQGPSRRMVSK